MTPRERAIAAAFDYGIDAEMPWTFDAEKVVAAIEERGVVLAVPHEVESIISSWDGRVVRVDRMVGEPPAPEEQQP